MSDHNSTPKQAKKTMKVVYLEDATIQSQIIHLLGFTVHTPSVVETGIRVQLHAASYEHSQKYVFSPCFVLFLFFVGFSVDGFPLILGNLTSSCLASE